MIKFKFEPELQSQSHTESEPASELESESGTHLKSRQVKVINNRVVEEESDSSFSDDQPHEQDKEEHEHEGKDNDDEEADKRLAKLEEKFANLGIKFHRAMNLYGLAQDVTLLLNQKFQFKRSKLFSKSRDDSHCYSHLSKPQQTIYKDENNNSGEYKDDRKPVIESKPKRVFKFLKKFMSFCVVLLANLTGIYVLVSHFIWEFKVLDAKNNSYSELVKDSASSKGWSVLKEFLENLRRHLSRIFSVSLTITWHLNCHNMEMIFVDCAKYYSMFYRNYLKQERENCMMIHDDEEEEDDDADDDNNEDKIKSKFKLLSEKRKELLEIGEKFYEFARRRVNWSIWLPFIHFCFNVSSISLFPSSNKRRMNRVNSNMNRLKNFTNIQNVTTMNANSNLNFSDESISSSSMSIFEQILDNFDSFHLSIHTAFHPYDYNTSNSKAFHGMKLKMQSTTTTTMTMSTSNNQQLREQQNQPQHLTPPLDATVSPFESAVYCLLELLIYSVYYHGPRIICATCLAIILNIHYQCISFFNCQLQACIKRPREKPLTSLDIINLVKQYDLIGRMHEKIENTFKWSIIQWYGLMFISCLMHIFAFTESTSAYVVNQQHLHAMAAARAASNLRLQQATATPTTSTTLNSIIGNDNSSSYFFNNYTTNPDNWTQQSLSAGAGNANANANTGGPNISYQTAAAAAAAANNNGSSTSFTIMFVRLASVFFVCYSPYLIYCEAFKIEAASNRAEQSVQKLVRRQDDPLAQAIEPSLFEPNYLSVGDYFHISKKSMSSLLGAIVTFSVMFIG